LPIGAIVIVLNSVFATALAFLRPDPAGTFHALWFFGIPIAIGLACGRTIVARTLLAIVLAVCCFLATIMLMMIVGFFTGFSF
jgi:hypothetical protein